jgi:hypothetical protein
MYPFVLLFKVAPTKEIWSKRYRRSATSNCLESYMPFAGYPSFALTTLWKEEAGVSFMEFALVGSLVLVFCMLLLLAWSKSA